MELRSGRKRKGHSSRRPSAASSAKLTPTSLPPTLVPRDPGTLDSREGIPRRPNSAAARALARGDREPMLVPHEAEGTLLQLVQLPRA